MIGFKSFADRTVVGLEQGMTSVVGPNGCGKSNILDALRWALGEQKPTALRGAHMQDVIFNGSEERQPMSMAEVTLTFDNEDGTLPVDFTEVQVTRRIYRSGESEYLINKASCRLRDVQEMFMDTGIGTNAYSMIGQGKISMVLSSKPEDRRYLFEEAAGIIKYKARKRVAMRKLDQAEQNQVRLGDIIHELERQMRSLKRQVNAATRHKELTDQLKIFEIRASWLKQQDLQVRIGDLKENFDNVQSEFDKGSQDLGELESKHEELNLGKLEVDRDLHVRREGVHEIDVELEKIARQVALVRQQISFSDEHLERAGEEQSTLLTQAGTLEEEIGKLQGQVASLKQEHLEMEQVIAAKQEDQHASVESVTQTDESLETIRAKSVESLGRKALTQTAIETLTVSIENIEEQLQTLYARQESSTARNEELVQELESKEHAETEKKSSLVQLEDESAVARERQEVMSVEIAEINTRWQGLRETVSRSEARLASLRELRDSYEGFAHGVRAIMQAKKNDHAQVRGIVGPVGDLVSTEQDFERAIEATLGGSINNIVVEQADMAKGAIAYLKENKSGRVTFLPLDTIRAGSNNAVSRVQGEPGVIGPAIDHAQFDDQYRSVMEYIFHNTVLVESIDDAIRLAKSHTIIPRLVTREGEVISSSGAVTGGRTKHDSRGLLGRSAEIGDLETEVIRLDEEIRTVFEAGQEKTKQLNEVKTVLADLTEREDSQRQELTTLTMEISQDSKELTQLTESLETINRDRDALYARRDDFENQRRESQVKVTDMETEDETLQREIAEAQEAASRARQAQSLLASELSDMRVTMANTTKSLEETERAHLRLQRDREQALVEAEKRSHDIQEFEENKVTLEKDILEHTERVGAMSESKDEAKLKVSEAEEHRQKLLDESETLDSTLKTLRDKVRENQSQAHKFEIELRHDEDQLLFFQERIQSEYGIELNGLTAEDVGTDELPEEERDRIVKETRTKLERLGNVNLMAIEEFQALTERNDFLVGQEEDLRKAREALLGVIERIDETIKVMFLETFNAVSENFREYFRRLFNGGQARIYLADENDPLECGIEIEARPPGKKPQSISLLSGGEQAMTAIALLFSIFKAKPSPFCVLDEVDAPLDDANIGRFIDMVEEFTQNTQFIVITHNKQTMAKANALYGVTQQERGVSQIVSVKLNEVKSENAA